MKNKLKRLAYLNSAGMFLVLLMGALVTKTDSGRGCGDDWPLCNGQFIPAYTIESMIEYSHRFVTGVVGIVLLIVTILVLKHVNHKEARIYVIASAIFTIIQAIMGALAVKSPQSSAVLALHFGISLLAFASTFLLAMAVREWSLQGEEGAKAREPGRIAAKGAEAGIMTVSKPFKWFVWFVFAYCYVVVYIGAYVRHTDSYGGCSGWPLCNGEIIPPLSGATGVMFGHRVAAFLLLISLIVLYVVARRHYGGSKAILTACGMALLLVIMQVLSGAYATVTLGSDWNLLASLLHTLLVSALFAVLSYLCVLTIRMNAKANLGVALRSTRV